MMSATRRTTLYLTLFGAATLAACTSDRPSIATTEPIESAPSAVLSGSSDCSVTSISGYAKTYFGSANNVASSDIKGLADACKAWVGAKGNAAKEDAAELKANGHALNIFKSIASAAKGREAFASAGANLTVAILPFTAGYRDEAPPSDATLIADFTKALGANGMYGVGTSTTYAASTPIFSRQATDHWGILAAWNRDVIVYGYIPETNAQLANQAGKYEIHTLPSSPEPWTGDFNVGVCFGTTNTVGKYINGSKSNFELESRIQHTVANDFLYESLDLCADEFVASSSMGSRLLAFAGRAADFLAPRNLYAFPAGTKTGVGGFGSDLSPFFTPTVGTPVVDLLHSPRDGAKSQQIVDTSGAVMEVSVYTGSTYKVGETDTRVPIRNAVAMLYVANNSGTTAGAILVYTPKYAMPSDFICPTNYACEMTENDGIARFVGAEGTGGLKVNKAGGYILAATADFDDILGNADLSVLFQMSNK